MSETTDWASDAEQRVLTAALPLIAAKGWSRAVALEAGRAAGLSAGETELLLPHGAADLAALLSRRQDAQALAALAGADPAALKIRERIARAVEARLDAACTDEAATRRWTGFLALPPNMSLGARLLWESADGLWRWAGDTAADENHYSKRAILSAILAAGLAIRLTSGKAAASKHVAARIDNVMAFEKWKAGVKPADLMRDVAVALGKIRYR
ncbi:COQ9 family protein [Phenylobacterium sp.]|jgi:ubiquinone biosynthesis protein COQ9|uniref:COQ9 family protein n=1 Tax=Phenylobacterium sp. TaxID=1871053 RepID=UPI002F3EA5F9